MMSSTQKTSTTKSSALSLTKGDWVKVSWEKTPDWENYPGWNKEMDLTNGKLGVIIGVGYDVATVQAYLILFPEFLDVKDFGCWGHGPSFYYRKEVITPIKEEDVSGGLRLQYLIGGRYERYYKD